ncbi:MAG TPA: type I-U CRISPR-associated helicase/endonuclease Cas3, partial [Lacipirellulaceae bacterium]|nr:type I-U CRISPR-associated helicase/endonuclease Cas3 [Lacipirellulaceae bacterium]
MNPLRLDDFPAYFHELHQREPYDWQCRLVKQIIEGTWPGAIDLPTGSGKTSCLDIAVFALASQAAWSKEKRTAPRRIFFCVNRRVIVDEAHQRAVKIAVKIADADGSESVLGRVAASLRAHSTLKRDSAPPLDVLELRGGVYRDNRWARSATQPTIVCTTIDQLGSRLLFRGYGVSANAAPIQAALIAYDSLVLLDEAHISRPFLQTLDFVKRYLDPEKWAEKPIGVKPMIVVPMTATPPEGVSDADVIRLSSKDRENTGLNNRLTASKTAKLLKFDLPKRTISEKEESVSRDAPDKSEKHLANFIEVAVAEATSLASGDPTAVGIIVNRVASAKAIYDRLREANKDNPDVTVELVIGSMRPIDRDRQAERLRELVGTKRPEKSERTSFIVATQCLEVGADYDFDALVTECASLDALRQRFGRLNRGGREIEAKAVILAGEKEINEERKLDKDKPLDPIYGNALSRTWNWLWSQAEIVTSEAEPAGAKKRGKKNSAADERLIDFGIDAFKPKWDSLENEDRQKLSAPSASKNAPVMLPAYVDFWCQTSPRPTPDPEVSLFIHGPEAAEPDVQVCWRADLVDDEHIKRSTWRDIVGLLPPTSAECMSVPISRVRRWLTDESIATDQGDLLGVAESTDASEGNGRPRGKQKAQLDQSRAGVLWRGSKESRLIGSPDDLRPGDTLVLPAQAAGWDVLGHVPEPSLETIDVAETAFQGARDRSALRLHPALRSRLPASEAITEFIAKLADPEQLLTQTDLRRFLNQIASEVGSDHIDFGVACRRLAVPRFGLLRETYPDDRGVVLTTRRRLGAAQAWSMPAIDEGDDDRSRTMREQPISLKDHTQHVRDEAMRTVRALPLDELETAYWLAADWHDLGKADERFQAMLRRTDRTDAWLLTGLDTAFLAKSDGLPQTPQQRQQARGRAGLPEGFRHEMLSVQIVEQSDLREKAGECIDFLLH